MAKKRTRKLKVFEKKLGREGAVGQCYHTEGIIEIDPRQKQREYLSTLGHEVLHCLFPDLSEDEVLEAEVVLARTLWDHGYRRIYVD